MRTVNSQKDFQKMIRIIDRFIQGKRVNPYIYLSYASAKKIKKKYKSVVSFQFVKEISHVHGICKFEMILDDRKKIP